MVLWDWVVVALVFLFHEIFMELYFGGKDDSFLFVEGLLIGDVLKEMSLEHIFSCSTLLPLDIDFS